MERTASLRLFRTNRLIWYAILALAALAAVWLFAENMTLEVRQSARFFYIYAVFIVLGLFYRTVRRDDNIYLLSHLALQWLSMVAVLGVLSYVSARTAFPLTDTWLIAADHMLFFDWKAYVAWVDALPWLATGFTYAYLSSGPQIMIMVALLFLCKKHAHNQRFLIAFMATALITVALAALFPAVGAYVYYDLDAATYFRHISPAAPRVHEAPLLAMRSHTTDALVFPLQGLVTFPSFHSALSIVLIYAAWPVLWFRLISLPLNIVVLLSTPGDGGHYLTDILGGVVIALVVILAVEKIRRPETAATRSTSGNSPTQW